MSSGAAPPGHLKSRRPRLQFAAAALFPLVLLALAASKLLQPAGLRQPLAVQQLLQAVDCGDASRSDASPVGGKHVVPAAAFSPRRQLRILMLTHDVTLTGAPQVLYEVTMHLRAQGHNVR